MRKRILLTALGGAAAIGGARLAYQCRHETGTARARLASIDRTAIATALGVVEYADRGVGEPVLSIHGIFGGCDQGLRNADGLFPGRRLIAPSRFGYLGSSLFPDATPADQADALAALLDELGIARTDVIAFSAGATSALQLALRHQGLVRRLMVLSGNWPGDQAAARPRTAQLLVHGEFPLCALKTFAPGLLARLAGVPRGFPLTAAQARVVTGVTESIFPVAPRADGVLFDLTVSNPDVNGYDLEAITVPTLIVHARDDPMASYEPARQAAARIPGARLISTDQGGHLLLGQREVVRSEVAAFLRAPGPMAQARARR